MIAKLKIIAGMHEKSEILLEEGTNLIGRSSKCNISLDSEMISRKHAMILFDGTKAYIEDLGSANGININGKNVRSYNLVHGDKIYLGNFVFLFSMKNIDAKTMVESEAKIDNPGNLSSRTKPDLILNSEASAVPEADNKLTFAINKEEYYKNKDLEIKNLNSGLPGNSFSEDKSSPFQDNFRNENKKNVEENTFSKLLSRIDLFDWKLKVLLAICLGYLMIFYFLIIGMMDYSTEQILNEAVNRGRILVRLLGEHNKSALLSGDDMLLDLGIVQSERGVVGAFIVDDSGKIRAPSTMQGNSLNDNVTNKALLEGKLTDSFSNIDSFRSQSLEGVSFDLAYPIRVWDEKDVSQKTIGVAKISFLPVKLVPTTVDVMKVTLKMALILLGVFCLIWFLLRLITIKPLLKIREEIESVIKGDTREVSNLSNFAELSYLVEGINRIIQKKGSPVSVDKDNAFKTFSFDNPEDKSQEFNLILSGVSNGIIIVDNSKVIKNINDAAIDMLKIPFNGGVGKFLTEVINEKDLVNAVNSIIENVASEDMSEKDINYGGPGMTLKIRGYKKNNPLGEITDIIFIFEAV